MTDLLEKLHALRRRHEKNKAGIEGLHSEIARLKAEITLLRRKLKSAEQRSGVRRNSIATNGN